jgi:hypothetical protein
MLHLNDEHLFLVPDEDSAATVRGENPSHFNRYSVPTHRHDGSTAQAKNKPGSRRENHAEHSPAKCRTTSPAAAKPNAPVTNVVAPKPRSQLSLSDDDDSPASLRLAHTVPSIFG